MAVLAENTQNPNIIASNNKVQVEIEEEKKEEEEKEAEDQNVAHLHQSLPTSSSSNTTIAVPQAMLGQVVELRKTCHQCRQKTKSLNVPCTNHKKNKLCPLNFCKSCLRNRYGENAEEVALLSDWKCPKCRGVCNCSVCMKRKGRQPTGMLVKTVKETGFSSVSEMLNAKGTKDMNSVSCNSDMIHENQADSCKALSAALPRKNGNGNSFLGKIDLNVAHVEETTSNPMIKEEEINQNVAFFIEKEEKECQEEVAVAVECNMKEEKTVQKNSSLSCNDDELRWSGNEDDDQAQSKPKLKRKARGFKTTDTKTDIALPQCIDLTNVAGIDFPADDVGHALQFLEFCRVFGEVFDLNKSQAESILRELTCGRSRRGGQFSSVFQFQIKLVSFLQENSGKESLLPSSSTNEEEWAQALVECISSSQCAFEDFPSNCFSKGADGYHSLNSSTKLRLLNFLCDAVLGTAYLRNWIDIQFGKYVETTKKGVGKMKKSKETLLARKDKEQCMKPQLEYEIVEGTLLKDGGSSDSVHDNVVLQSKAEAEKAQNEIVKATEVPKKKQRPDVLRKEAVLFDNEGHVFWQLDCCPGEETILLQEIGNLDPANKKDKWFTYEVEQRKDVEKYIRSRKKRRRLSRREPLLEKET